MAGTEVGSLYYEMNIDEAKLDKTLDSSDKKVKEFGDNVSKSGDELKKGMEKTAKGLAIVGAGLTLVSKNATDFTIQAVKDARSLGREIGVSATEASRLTAAFGRMGIGADQASQMFGVFSKNIVKSTESSEANRLAGEKLKIQVDQTKRAISETSAEIKKSGDKSGDLNLKLRELNNTLASQKQKLNESSDGFAKIGVNTRDAAGHQKGFNTLLFEVADKFQAMPDGIDKSALSMELFGRQGKDLLPILNLGSDGIKDLEKDADRLGLTLTDKTINGVMELSKSQKDLKQTSDAMKIAIGTATTPVLTTFNQAMNDAAQAMLGGPELVRQLTVGFLAFGGPILGGAAGLLEFGANAVGAWPAIEAAGAAVYKWTGLQWLLNASLWASPITWIVLGVAALTAGLILAYQHSQTFRDIVSGAFEWVKSAAEATWNWLKVNWPYLLPILFGPFGAAATIVIKNWDSIMAFFKAAPGRIGGFFKAVGDAITSPFVAAFNAVKNAWNNTVGRISFKAPDWVPGFGGKGWSMPKFAKGAVATGPTVGMFGEAGTEAVLPLSYLNRYNTLFDRIENMSNDIGKNGTTDNSSVVFNIGTINNQADEDFVLRRFDRQQKLVSMGVSPT